MMTMTMKLSDVDLLSSDGLYPQTTGMLKVAPVLMPAIRPPLRPSELETRPTFSTSS